MKSKASKKHGDDYELPPGVESVDMWGKAICTLPKVSSRCMTSQMLIAEADFNKDSKEYLVWIFKTSHKSPKAEDFKAHMDAVKFSPIEPSTVNYPGTTLAREFGS